MSDNPVATDSTKAQDLRLTIAELVATVKQLAGLAEDHARRIAVLEAQIKAATPQAVGQAFTTAKAR